MTETQFPSKRPAIQRQGHSDHFQTPPEALEPLWPYLRPEWTIWEPAAGKGNLVRGLKARGHDVIASELSDGQDFHSWQPPRWWDAQITNPPYATKDEWLARSYQLGRPFALLLPLTTLESRRRQALFRAHGVQMILLPKRVDFETPTGKKGGAWFPVAWFCWRLNLPQQLTFWQPESTAQPTLEGLE